MTSDCPYCGFDRTRRLDVYNRLCPRCKNTFSMRTARTPKAASAPQMESASKRFWVFNHQNKADAMVSALTGAGYEESLNLTNFAGVRFALTDYAAWGRAKRLEKIRRQGVGRFFVYPHSARPAMIADVEPEWEWVTATFVTAPGHIEIMQSYGYPKPLHVAGWMLCPMREFQPRKEAYHILFAPIHPRCAEEDKKVNQRVFAILEKLARKDLICLTVRYISTPGGSGLEEVEHPNIHYVAGQMNNAYDQIDNADVVIGSGTIAYIAVARGVPTVMMAERTLPEHWLKEPVLFANNWDKYVDRLAYPLDILEAPSPLKMLEGAVRCDESVREWRERMIGEPFNPARFVETLEGYL